MIAQLQCQTLSLAIVAVPECIISLSN